MNPLPNLQSLRKTLKQQQHRALIVLSGSSDWQLTQLNSQWSANETVLWIGEPNKNLERLIKARIQFVENTQLNAHLGQEIDSVIIDVQHGLNANALGITSGMIRSGGLLVLLTPDIETWRTLANPDNKRFLNSPYQTESAAPYFTEHLIHHWQNGAKGAAIWFHEKESLSVIPKTLFHADLHTTQCILPTQGQIQVIQAAESVAFGHRKRPLVITADRGRGKSSVLGIAAINCLIEGKSHIVLTASRLEQAKKAFTQAADILNELQKTLSINITTQQTGRICFELDAQLKIFEFIAPDQLIIEATKADVLMVDEAAHLPTPLLTKLLTRHHRMIFATTLHGYEGSGRGFELRFKKTLTQLTPNWKNIHLSESIRWAEQDPLEAAINNALFLNPPNENKVEDITEETCGTGDLTLEEISAQSLLSNTQQFHNVFKLLVQAHYQTSPNDLQLLLSAPNLKIIIASHKEQLLGVALCIEEGTLMPKTKHIHGHLVPQLLVKHYALPDFFILSSWRIMRIAVHPNVQRKGIGKQLLDYIKKSAQQQRIGYLSSSFGANESLLPFWIQQGYTPVHIGVKRDKSSGCHSIVVTQSLTPMAQQALANIQRAFQVQFPHLLMESLPHFSSSMILSILQTFRFKTYPAYLEETVKRFCLGQRVYESVSGQLWDWGLRNPHLLAALTPQSLQDIWCDKVFKKQSWKEVAKHHNLSGKKGVEKALIEILESLSKKT